MKKQTKAYEKKYPMGTPVIRNCKRAGCDVCKTPKANIHIFVEEDGALWFVREAGNYPTIPRNTEFENSSQFFDNRWEAMEHAVSLKEKYQKKGDFAEVIEK